MTINPEDHMPLAQDLASKFDIFPSTFPMEERLSVAYLALMQAVDKFDESKGYRFATYAHPVIVRNLRRYAHEHCRKGMRVPQWSLKGSTQNIPTVENIASFGENAPTIPKECEPPNEAENKELLEEILSRCSEREKFILKQILAGQKQKDIAASIGCSKQRVSQYYQRILSRERKLNEDAKNS